MRERPLSLELLSDQESVLVGFESIGQIFRLSESFRKKMIFCILNPSDNWCIGFITQS